MKVDAPTCEQVYEDDDLRLINETRGPWRHGSYITAVYLRKADGTYWKARYALSSDGETNGLREGDASISQCWPHEVTAIEYRDADPDEPAIPRKDKAP